MERRADALTDALTGLPNRRALFEAGRSSAKTAISMAERFRPHLRSRSFQQTNDCYGHAFGDRVPAVRDNGQGRVDGRASARLGRGIRSHTRVSISRGRRERGCGAPFANLRAFGRWSCGASWPRSLFDAGGGDNLGSPQDLRTSLRATVRKASGGAAFS
jgi:hypothetical protein